MENILLYDLVWNRIKERQKETFRQMRGGEFSYIVNGNYIHLDRTNWQIPKSDIEEALALVPLKNTTPVQHLNAPSYIYALLTDERIKGKLW